VAVAEARQDFRRVQPVGCESGGPALFARQGEAPPDAIVVGVGARAVAMIRRRYPEPDSAIGRSNPWVVDGSAALAGPCSH
jgi:hypothetical protein